MYYIKPLKSPTHIHFWWKIFIDSRQFFALWFWDFPVFYMRIMQSENFATNIQTHYRQSETAPHIRALYARKISPQIYMRNYGAFRIGGRLIELWYLGVCLCHVLYMRSSFGWGRFLLIGRCQSLVVKVWWDFINSL